MANQRSPKIRRAGSYVVKAAESRPSEVRGKRNGRVSTPSTSDKELARYLLSTRQP
jgi:hypothetical protein